MLYLLGKYFKLFFKVNNRLRLGLRYYILGLLVILTEKSATKRKMAPEVFCKNHASYLPFFSTDKICGSICSPPKCIFFVPRYSCITSLNHRNFPNGHCLRQVNERMGAVCDLKEGRLEQVEQVRVYESTMMSV